MSGRSERGGRGRGGRRGRGSRGRGDRGPEIENQGFLVGYTMGEGSRTVPQSVPLEVPLTNKRPRLYRPNYHQPPAEVQTPDIPPEVEMAPPSPAAFETFGGDEDERCCLNFGSDDDSDSDTETNHDDDGAPFPMFIPRADRMFLINDDDDDDDGPCVHPPESALPPPPAEPLEYGPKDLFQFDWVSFPSVPVDPTERRETFRAGEVGPLAVYPSPYEAFTAIWTTEFMQEIVVQTNRYAQQIKEQKIRDGSLGPSSRITHWRDTNVDELYVYFAMILSLGHCVKGDVKEYWSTKDPVTLTPGFAKYMSYNRMILLNSCLHFADNTTDLRTLTRPEARIFKIKPVVQHLNDRFQTLYRLDRNIAIDESLTQWKGWLVFKQFIKNKAAGAAIKTFELCESRTGYLWKFEVFSGREDSELERNISGYTVNLVLDLVKGLEDKGYTVWMDNYYNSPALARVLKSLGFDCVGTLRTNRQGVPPQIKNLKKKDMAIGQISGCTSGDVDILVWRDANRVPMISTYHGAGVHTSRGKTKPIVVYDYNVCMGGVDKKDQMLSAYPIERKRTRVWYKKFFRRLLNASVLNAFILHRDRALPNTQPHIRKHRVFRRALVAQLLERHHKPDRILDPMRVGNQPRVILPPEVLQHFPKEFGLVPNTTKKERIRRSCVVCHKRQQFYCAACEVPLCIDKCIVTYHSKL